MHILFITFFSLFVFHLQVGVGPLLLNASLLLVLTTDYSDWLVQVGVGPLLLNASLLLVLTTDYSDWLVQVTELIDNWQWWNLLSFDVKRLKEAWIRNRNTLEEWCCNQKVMSLFNVEKRSISESLCSLLAPLFCIIFSCLKFLTLLIFLIPINSFKC